MRSSTPNCHSSSTPPFIQRYFKRWAGENWTNLEAILQACPSHYSHCSSETCQIKPKHGLEVNMTIWWVPPLWHSVSPPLKNSGYAPGAHTCTTVAGCLGSIHNLWLNFASSSLCPPKNNIQFYLDLILDLSFWVQSIYGICSLFRKEFID